MRVIFLSALLMVTALISGFINVNVSHHIILPSELTQYEQIVQVRTYYIGENLIPAIKTKTDIRLNAEIKSPVTVRAIIKVLQEAGPQDEVVFHIAGVGGQVDTAFDLINNIKSTKAHTVMIVESPSYSAHSFIAVSGNELIMLPYTYLMFHTSSAYGTNCFTVEGVDRTVPNVEHCLKFLENHLFEVNKFIDNIAILTPQEKQSIKTGHDVYITSEDFYVRQNNLN